MTALPGKERLDYFDSVRGLAAMSVVWCHYVNGFGLPKGTHYLFGRTPLHIWWDGLAAVSLFFVLSGFVLSLRFFNQGFTTRNFFSKFSYLDYGIVRLFRIWIPYLCVFALTLLCWRFLGKDWATSPLQSLWIQGFWNSWITKEEFFKESALVYPVDAYRAIPQAWTLSVELMISLFVPLAAALALFRASVLLIGVILAVYILEIPMFALHFVMGVFLAKLYRENGDKLKARIRPVVWPLLTVSILLYTYRFSVAPFYPKLVADNGIWFLTGLGSLGILSCILANARMQRALLHPLLVFLGRISYSVYLCHFAIILTFSSGFLAFLHSHHLCGETFAWLLTLILTTLLTAGLSALLERWIEKPSRQLGKRLSSVLRQPEKSGALTSIT